NTRGPAHEASSCCDSDVLERDLLATVFVDRTPSVVLPVLASRSVEHVLTREDDKKCVRRGDGLGDRPGCLDVHQPSCCGLALATLDVGICRSEDYDLRPDLPESGPQRLGVRDVESETFARCVTAIGADRLRGGEG